MGVAAHFVVARREGAVPGAGFAQQREHLVRLFLVQQDPGKTQAGHLPVLVIRAAANEFVQCVGRVLVTALVHVQPCHREAGLRGVGRLRILAHDPCAERLGFVHIAVCNGVGEFVIRS